MQNSAQRRKRFIVNPELERSEGNPSPWEKAHEDEQPQQKEGRIKHRHRTGGVAWSSQCSPGMFEGLNPVPLKTRHGRTGLPS